MRLLKLKLFQCSQMSVLLILYSKLGVEGQTLASDGCEIRNLFSSLGDAYHKVPYFADNKVNMVFTFETAQSCQDVQIGLYFRNDTYITELNRTKNITISSNEEEVPPNQHNYQSFLHQYKIDELDQDEQYVLKIFLYEDWPKQIETLMVPSSKFMYWIFNASSNSQQLVSNYTFLYEEMEEQQLQQDIKRQEAMNQNEQSHYTTQSQQIPPNEQTQVTNNQIRSRDNRAGRNKAEEEYLEEMKRQQLHQDRQRGAQLQTQVTNNQIRPKDNQPARNKTEEEYLVMSLKARFATLFAHDLKLAVNPKHYPMYPTFIFASIYDNYNQRLFSTIQQKVYSDLQKTKFQMLVLLCKTFSWATQNPTAPGQYVHPNQQNLLLQLIGRVPQSLPIMVSLDEVEQENHFLYHRLALEMPLFNEFENNFYSYNSANIHFISLNIKYFEKHFEQKEKILHWLEQDLIDVRQASNLLERPWVVVHASAPFYCSQIDSTGECNKSHAFEHLFFQYRVDLVISSGIGVYERYLPQYIWETSDIDTKMPYFTSPILQPNNSNDDLQNEENEEVQQESRAFKDIQSQEHLHQFIVNPLAPTYVLEGSGTIDQNYQLFKNLELIPSCVTRVHKEGFGVLTARNGTHLLYEHFNLDNVNHPVDAFFLIKSGMSANDLLPEIVKQGQRVYAHKPELFIDFREYYLQFEVNRTLRLKQKEEDIERQRQESLYEKNLQKEALDIYAGYDFDKAQLYSEELTAEDNVEEIERARHRFNLSMFICSFVLYFVFMWLSYRFKNRIKKKQQRLTMHSLQFIADDQQFARIIKDSKTNKSKKIKSSVVKNQVKNKRKHSN